MSRYAVTGAHGFLGWHLQGALRESGDSVVAVSVGEGFDQDQAVAAVNESARVIHLAGVNRASDEEVSSGNIGFARQLASALRAAELPPEVVVFANSTQSTNGSAYGDSKARAASILADAAAEIGAEFIDVQLPNLYGEHGRPFYNSVTATFSHLLAVGEMPNVENDKLLTMLHAQNAADLLTGAAPLAAIADLQRDETVTGLLARLEVFNALYRRGEIPDITDDFDRDLFNSYRSYTFPSQSPIALRRHSDDRGSFFEIIRSNGGTGQSSFSTTVSGVTRGDHFHRRKIERFTVLQGRARISLRRLHTDQVVSFDVSGDAPSAVDMPTLWAHNITNIGDEDLYTSFWTNDIFDPQNPDTIPEVV